MSPDPYVVPQSLPRSPRWKSGGRALPPEDATGLRSLAVSAGWALEMLQAPPRSPKKCPVLPRFVPQSVPHGVGVSWDPAAPDFFHSSANSQKDRSEGDGEPKCPYIAGN